MAGDADGVLDAGFDYVDCWGGGGGGCHGWGRGREVKEDRKGQYKKEEKERKENEQGVLTAVPTNPPIAPEMKLFNNSPDLV